MWFDSMKKIDDYIIIENNEHVIKGCALFF